MGFVSLKGTALGLIYLSKIGTSFLLSLHPLLLLLREMDEDYSTKLHLLSESQRDLNNNNGERWNEEVVREIKKQMGLAGPLVLVSFLQYSLQLISIVFVGHLGELQLSGASMAFSFAGVTGFSLLVCATFLLFLFFSCAANHCTLFSFLTPFHSSFQS